MFTDDVESPPLCDGFDSEILGNHTLATVNPYLSPFAIEFLLVGVCVAYAMFQKIGRGWVSVSVGVFYQDDSENDVFIHCRAKSDQELCKIRVPNPETFFSHRNHEHCFRGSFFGSVTLLISLISLGIFVTWNFQGRSAVSAIHISFKSMWTFMWTNILRMIPRSWTRWHYSSWLELHSLQLCLESWKLRLDEVIIYTVNKKMVT